MMELEIDLTLLEWVQSRPVLNRVRSTVADNGALAAFYSIGATWAFRQLTAVQCGTKGNIYCGLLFYDETEDGRILVIRKWTKEWKFDSLTCVPATEFYTGLMLPMVGKRQREFKWEQYARHSFAPSVHEHWRPILGGRFTCWFPGLAEQAYVEQQKL